MFVSLSYLTLLLGGHRLVVLAPPADRRPPTGLGHWPPKVPAPWPPKVPAPWPPVAPLFPIPSLILRARSLATVIVSLSLQPRVSSL